MLVLSYALSTFGLLRKRTRLELAKGLASQTPKLTEPLLVPLTLHSTKFPPVGLKSLKQSGSVAAVSRSADALHFYSTGDTPGSLRKK